jgi:hypothetical protein
MTPAGSPSAGRASRLTAEVVLLGPQRPRPNCPEVLEEVATGDGPVVVLRAGWRHDETDDEAVRRILGPRTQVLPLYGWFDIVDREVPEIQAAYRARQDALIAIKRLHRRRLGPALQAVRDLRQSRDGPHGREALGLAIEDLRRIDAQLLEANDAVHRAHPDVTEPWNRFPLVAHLRDRAAEALGAARAVCIAGGHMAVLLNRLSFFGIDRILRERLAEGMPVVAWSAGSMLLTERILLYYDDPPDGPTWPELLDRGFGFVPGVVVLPHARQRLDLDDPARVGLLATRLAPTPCVGLENGAWLVRTEGGWANRGERGSAVLLGEDGRVEELPEVTT